MAKKCNTIGKGLELDSVEINFIFSFMLSFAKFEDVYKAIFNKWKIAEDKKAFYKKVDDNNLSADETNCRFWGYGCFPGREGLSSNLSIGTQRIIEGKQDHFNEIWCFTRKEGNFEILSGYIDNHSNKRIVNFGINIRKFDIVTRLFDSGCGTTTFKFVLSQNDSARLRIFDKVFSNGEFLQCCGWLPWIFNILTMGRAEGSPFSALLLNDKGEEFYKSPEYIEWISDPNKSSVGNNNTWLLDYFSQEYDEIFDILPKDKKGSNCVRLEDNLKTTKRWQNPYIVTIGNLKHDASVINRKGRKVVWWHEGYEDTKKIIKNGIDIRRCYKETILLLLRLFQWRKFLGVDDYFNKKAISIGDTLQNVTVLPELLGDSYLGNVFKDLNLVWDTRYLLLYHERSCLLLSCLDEKTVYVEEKEFKKRFTKSLLNLNEILRTHWHSSIILNALLDEVIEELKKKEDSYSPAALKQINSTRESYALTLHDPLPYSTDAGALIELYSRGIKKLNLNLLRDLVFKKLQVVENLITDKIRISITQ